MVCRPCAVSIIVVCVCVCVATKSRLERELAEAVQESASEEEAPRCSSPSSDGGDPGSDDEDQAAHPLMSMPQVSSMEMSLWSLDASATSSLDTSLTTDTEVREALAVSLACCQCFMSVFRLG